MLFCIPYPQGLVEHNVHNLMIPLYQVLFAVSLKKHKILQLENGVHEHTYLSSVGPIVTDSGKLASQHS